MARVRIGWMRATCLAWCASVCALLLCPGVVIDAQRPGNGAAVNLTRGCLETFDPNRDYFPDKAAIEDATIFSVEYRKSYKVVTVRGGTPGAPSERYVLAQCGAPLPKLVGDLAAAQVVRVPIQSLFAFSTTHLALLVDLDRVDVLTGVAELDVVMSPDVQARIRGGKIIEFAKVGLVIDVERVVAAKPALLMDGGSSSATLSVIRSAGIPVVANAEWLEPTPLGRAEWLKYMALFLNEERRAQTVYGAVKERYRALAARVADRPQAERPLVMTGRSANGIFTIAGGRSYVAALITDAGGRYVWADNAASGIASVDLEAEIQRAVNADIWINGGGWKNLPAMLQDEPRYAEFKAVRQGQVWVYERRMTPAGGNDYWSRSVTRPDLMLADLIKIFHPTLMNSHDFEWYMPVPARQ